jgi:endonuclease G
LPRAEPGLARRRTVLAAEVSQILFQQRRVGVTNDIQSIEFLERGQIAKRSVGKLILAGKGIGTGFLVGHDLLMTARHVLPSAAEASDIKLALDDEENYVGTPIAAKIYQLDPLRFYWENQGLDVAIVAVASLDPTNPMLSDFGSHRIVGSDNAIMPGAAVSIIQHPNGEPKRIVVHNSHFVSNDKSADAHLTCWYTGDTESGSSGSPVFDAEWKVVAVHRRFVPETNERGEILGMNGEPIVVEGTATRSLEELAKGHKIAVYANEGARTSQIIAALNDSHLADLDMDQIRQNLLATWAGGR